MIGKKILVKNLFNLCRLFLLLYRKRHISMQPLLARLMTVLADHRCIDKILHLHQILHTLRSASAKQAQFVPALRTLIILLQTLINSAAHLMDLLMTCLIHQLCHDKFIITKTTAHRPFIRTLLNDPGNLTDCSVSFGTSILLVNLIQIRHIHCQHTDKPILFAGAFHHRLGMLHKTGVIKHSCQFIVDLLLLYSLIGSLQCIHTAEALHTDHQVM